MKAGAIEKGTVLVLKKQPYRVLERDFFAPGKGAAVVRCKVRNLITGQVLRETLKTAEQVEEAQMGDCDAQFLYADDDGYHFMDSQNYEQFLLSPELLDERRFYLQEGEHYRILLWQDEAIDITIPPKVTLLVTEAPEAIRGDTVSGASKRIVCETGLELKAPLFIRENDRVVINSDTGEYVERVSG